MYTLSNILLLAYYIHDSIYIWIATQRSKIRLYQIVHTAYSVFLIVKLAIARSKMGLQTSGMPLNVINCYAKLNFNFPTSGPFCHAATHSTDAIHNFLREYSSRNMPNFRKFVYF